MKSVILPLPLFLLTLLIGGRAVATGDGHEPVTFDHSAFSKLLGETVTDGRVDYVALKKKRTRLDAYLSTLADAKPERMAKDGALAFWINAYNAFTLKLIVLNYPAKKSITDIPDAWKQKAWRVAGKKRSLDEIEHEIIRKRFKEPRVHFVLVCASISCPDLPPRAFAGDDLNVRLTEATRRFLSDPGKGAKVVLAEGKPPVLRLSMIFKWFAADFTAGSGSVLDFVLPYLPTAARRGLRPRKDEVKISYLEYDWSLNAR